MANTFSKFGLNINLLMGGDAAANDSKKTGEDASKSNIVSDFESINAKTGSQKLQSLLDQIPDFTALTEPTVSMGQLFA